MSSSAPVSPRRSAAPPGAAAADRAARLEEERDFLLASLRDLEAEHDAGDLDDADYATLRDDYTARAAEVLRSLEQDRERRAGASDGPSSRTALWLAVVGLAMVLAVVAVVQGSGRRTGSDGLTGDLPRTRTGQLAEAQAKLADGDLEGALDIYEAVLEEDPADAEALTYSAWVGRMGELGDDDALALLDEALAVEPGYADAQVFRTVVLQSLGRSDDAAAQLADIEASAVPGPMRTTVAGMGIEVANARVAEGDVAGANLVLEDVLRIDPENLSALVTKGLLLAQVAQAASGEDADVLAARSLAALDEAVALAEDQPTELPAALLARGQVRAVLGRTDEARSDLERIESLELDPSLEDQLDVLRRAVATG